MKRKRSALVAGSIVLVALLLGVLTRAEYIVAEQPLSWSHLTLVSFFLFLGMAVLTYRMLPETAEPQGGGSHDR